MEETHPATIVADLSKAPLPTAQTLKRRRSLPVQLGRFVVFNTRMIRMVHQRAWRLTPLDTAQIG